MAVCFTIAGYHFLVSGMMGDGALLANIIFPLGFLLIAWQFFFEALVALLGRLGAGREELAARRAEFAEGREEAP